MSGSPNRSICYRADINSVLSGYVDSSYADDILDRKSTSGYVFLFGKSPISWKSIKQKCVAASTTEAEYIAASEMTKQAIFYLNLASNVLPINRTITAFSDNTSCIRISKDSNLHSKTKHIDVRFHITRQAQELKQIDIKFCKSGDNLADMFTKPLSGKLFFRHRNSLFLSNHVPTKEGC